MTEFVKTDKIDKDKAGSDNGKRKVDAAFAKAVNLVCRAPKTKKQILEYLAAKGYSAETAEKVAEKMEEYRYIDDAGYAEAYVSFYGNVKGKRRLLGELRQKGVSEEIAVSCMEQLPCQRDAALAAAKKFMKNRPFDRDSLAKLYRHLAGKGYEFSVCTDVVRTFTAGGEVDCGQEADGDGEAD